MVAIKVEIVSVDGIILSELCEVLELVLPLLSVFADEIDDSSWASFLTEDFELINFKLPFCESDLFWEKLQMSLFLDGILILFTGLGG